MSVSSRIEWTDATWNPVSGCTQVSPGCDNCYAERFAERWRGTSGHPFERGFDLQLRPERLEQPLRWRRPRRIFVNSMSDLFHPGVPDDYIAAVFAVMAIARQHTFQVLTKRHARMRSLLSSPSFWHAVAKTGRERYIRCQQDWLTVGAMLDGRPLPNVWLGVSAENQKWAGIRIPALLRTPAAVRFVSAEPLLGPIDLKAAVRTMGSEHGHGLTASCVHWGCCERRFHGIDWVIVGGESGPGARPMHPAWVRSLRDQCTAAGTAFFFKQWGEWIPESQGAHVITARTTKRARYVDLGGDQRPANVGVRGDAATCHRVGKKAAGRLLDGRTWDEYPGRCVHETGDPQLRPALSPWRRWTPADRQRGVDR